MGNSLKAINDTVRFLVELAVLAAVGYWGFHNHASWAAKLVFGVGGPILIAAVWGMLMAPRSSRRAPEGVRALLEVLIFALATTALVASTSAGVAITFAIVAAVNALLDHALGRTLGSDA